MSEKLKYRLRNYSKLIRLTIMVMLGALLFGCAQQSTTSLPAIKAKAEGVHHPGRFVWFELLTEESNVAKGFYSDLFGWTYTESAEYPGYTLIMHDNQEIGGILQVEGSSKEAKESRWISSVAVGDVDKVTAELVTLGGKVLYGPVDSGERGRLAQVSDPQGADFIVLRTRKGDPEMSTFTSGEPVWVDLFTKDRQEAALFYKSLLDYSTVPSGKDTDHFCFMFNNQPKAGLAEVDWDDLEVATWLPYIGVTNLRKKVVEAIDLGGTLVAHTETAAVILDPSGAAIGLQLLPRKGEK